MAARPKERIITCRPKSLPASKLIAASQRAAEINPLNHAPLERLSGPIRGFRPTHRHLALLITKYWGAAGVHLTVGFLDSPPAVLQKHLLLHMNAWNKSANVKFSLS